MEPEAAKAGAQAPVEFPMVKASAVEALGSEASHKASKQEPEEPNAKKVGEERLPGLNIAKVVKEFLDVYVSRMT